MITKIQATTAKIPCAKRDAVAQRRVFSKDAFIPSHQGSLSFRETRLLSQSSRTQARKRCLLRLLKEVLHLFRSGDEELINLLKGSLFVANAGHNVAALDFG